ncbi:hypothetical protein HY029_01660 [Candidatus Gottesmanbacteria bacterium]|nr:hypothetical protein [Candidatus Gottesmanbacteria bacterium]
MKKAFIYLTFLTFFLFFHPSPANAITRLDIQNMIDTSIAPINSAISSLNTTVTSIQIAVSELQTRVSSLESNVAAIFIRLTSAENNIGGINSRLTSDETTISSQGASIASDAARITNLEHVNGLDFNLPQSFQSTFSPSSNTITISPANLNQACSWNGINIAFQTVSRGIAHLSTGDVFTAGGNCKVITFSNISNFPASGTTFPVDLFFFWQGKEKQTTLTLTAP